MLWHWSFLGWCGRLSSLGLFLKLLLWLRLLLLWLNMQGLNMQRLNLQRLILQRLLLYLFGCSGSIGPAPLGLLLRLLRRLLFVLLGSLR